jgi:hypothetical protein
MMIPFLIVNLLTEVSLRFSLYYYLWNYYKDVELVLLAFTILMVGDLFMGQFRYFFLYCLGSSHTQNYKQFIYFSFGITS